MNDNSETLPTQEGWYPEPSGVANTLRWFNGREWTNDFRPMFEPIQPAFQPVPPVQKSDRRVFVWVFLTIQGLFAAWLVSGLFAVSSGPDDCSGLSQELCDDAFAVGAGLGVVLIFMLWVAIDFLLGVGYVIWKLSQK